MNEQILASVEKSYRKGVLDYGLFGPPDHPESITNDEDATIHAHPRRYASLNDNSAPIEIDDVDRLHYASAPGASMRISVPLKSFGSQFQQLLVKSILARVLQTQLLLPSQFAQRRSALA